MTPIELLTKELMDMGFPEQMANNMAVGALTKAGIDSKSIHNNLPAFYIAGGEIMLIDTSVGLRNVVDT